MRTMMRAHACAFGGLAVLKEGARGPWMLCDGAVTTTHPGMLTLTNPVERAAPSDHADWHFKAKFDGFRAPTGKSVIVSL